MCTVSWLTTAHGYELFCNRDERRERKTALAPTVRTSRGVRFVAPTDGEAGGTWIAANEYGLTVCLLNHYLGVETPGACRFKSRGLLPPDLMSLCDAADVARTVESADLSRFQPFTLLALAPGVAPAVMNWTGRRLLREREGTSMMPLTSSSFACAEVARVREELFCGMAADSSPLTADLLLRFHASHVPAAGPHSVCMHRPEASTVSFSRVRVAAGCVEFYYQPGPPCAGERGVRVSLLRIREHETLPLDAALCERQRGTAA